MKKYDAVVIGFGKGGKTLSVALAARGYSVAMVEKSDKMYGGTCINVGCIPSKALVNSALQSETMGGGFEEKAGRYAAAVSEKNRLTAMLRQKNFDKLDKNPAVTVINGAASFAGAHTVEVATAAGVELIEGERIFINTGARPVMPDTPGLKDSRFSYLSEEFMELTALPKRLVIIGAGYISMEYASMFASFGSSVTVLQHGEKFLPREDGEIAQAVLQSLKARGVEVLASAQVQAITDEENFAVLSVATPDGGRRLEAEAILVAVGRKPNVEGLNLQKAGVELTSRGAIQTDEHLRTTAPGIWAMGDVAGGLQFTYISLDDYRIVLSDIAGDGSRTTANRGAVPYSVFLSPPFSRVGLSEDEARSKGFDVKIARLQAAAIPKAQVLRRPTGLMKAVIDGRSNEILGAHFFCEESYEMINLIKLAMDARIPYTVLRDAIYTHPTMSEALNDLFAAIE